MMKFFLILTACLLNILIPCNCTEKNGAGPVSIPTGGNSWVINDVLNGNEVISGNGITNWTDPSAVIRTWFRVEEAGILNISLRAKIVSGKSRILTEFANMQRKITLENVTFDTIFIGSFKIDKPGYHWIDLQGISRTSGIYAEIPEIILDGPATRTRMHFVGEDFYFGRRGPSVHLRYEIPENSADIQWFYNEINT